MMAVDAAGLLLILSLSSLSGQSARQAPPAAAPGSSTSVGWAVGLEYQHDRFEYHFENPSSFDTAELVPHAFDQRYDTDNVWLTGRLQFTLGTRPFETEGGLSTTATGAGRDYDTFYQPDGNIIVYGTTADTEARSWRVSQYVGLGSWRRLHWRAAYSYRRDCADFRPSYSTTVQTKPPSSTAVWNTSRETTVSEVHEIRLGAQRSFAPGRGWQFRLTADAAPATLARLTTILPDKYPEPIVFIAKGLSMDVALHVTRQIGRWRAGTVMTYSRAWSYQQSAAYRRKTLSAAAVLVR
jgi:hypothetical protein